MCKVQKALVCATTTAVVVGGGALTAVVDSASQARSAQSSQVETVPVNGGDPFRPVVLSLCVDGF